LAAVVEVSSQTEPGSLEDLEVEALAEVELPSSPPVALGHQAKVIRVETGQAVAIAVLALVVEEGALDRLVAMPLALLPV
jgi:hypothetical protein